MVFGGPLPCPSPRGIDAFGQTWTLPAGGGDGGGGLAVPRLKPWPATRKPGPATRRLPGVLFAVSRSVQPCARLPTRAGEDGTTNFLRPTKTLMHPGLSGALIADRGSCYTAAECLGKLATLSFSATDAGRS